ncbi:hypothetical protein ACWC9T_32330 [Kitasatospora sp. NPDC001159]
MRYGSSPAPRRGLAVGASALVIPLIAALTLGGTPSSRAVAPAGASDGPTLLASGTRVLGLTPSLARAREDFPRHITDTLAQVLAPRLDKGLLGAP